MVSKVNRLRTTIPSNDDMLIGGEPNRLLVVSLNTMKMWMRRFDRHRGRNDVVLELHQRRFMPCPESIIRKEQKLSVRQFSKCEIYRDNIMARQPSKIEVHE